MRQQAEFHTLQSALNSSAGSPPASISLAARDRKVTGDGNSLFRATTFVLYGSEMAHEKVHELLVQFVSENQGSF